MVQQVLRTLRLKGVANAAMLGAALRRSEQAVTSELSQLAADGKVKETPRGFMLTPAGRDVLAQQLADERAKLDVAKVGGLYKDFCDLNVQFKALMTDWQIRTIGGVEQPNNHADRDYDAAIIARLRFIDTRLKSLLGETAEQAPRLAPYIDRFSDALHQVEAGNTSMMAAPIKDSYHTLWFELHEEFIELCGRSRASEAAEGRAD